MRRRGWTIPLLPSEAKPYSAFATFAAIPAFSFGAMWQEWQMYAIGLLLIHSSRAARMVSNPRD